MGIISVVIPLFNKRNYIERALRSALAQNLRPDEIIVVDDGSTDGGGDLAESIGRTLDDIRIIVIHQQNNGVSIARNRGIAEAKGELIAFLDADDAWKPQFLEKIDQLKDNFPQAGAFATAYEVVMPNGKVQRKQFNILPHNSRQGLITNYARVAPDCPVGSSAVAIPKKVLKEVGGFAERERKGEDVDLWLRIALRYPIAWSCEYLSSYFLGISDRTMGRMFYEKEPKVSYTARQAIASGLVPPEQVKDLIEYAAHFQIHAAVDCLKMGNKSTSLELLSFSKGTLQHFRRWWEAYLIAHIPGNFGRYYYPTKHSFMNRLIKILEKIGDFEF